jgi:hypothetical protein
MKKFLIALNLVIWSIVCIELAHAETKKICHDRVVKGKTISVCKNVKIHEAVADATKIPVKKK